MKKLDTWVLLIILVVLIMLDFLALNTGIAGLNAKDNIANYGGFVAIAIGIAGMGLIGYIGYLLGSRIK